MLSSVMGLRRWRLAAAARRLVLPLCGDGAGGALVGHHLEGVAGRGHIGQAQDATGVAGGASVIGWPLSSYMARILP